MKKKLLIAFVTLVVSIGVIACNGSSSTSETQYIYDYDWNEMSSEYENNALAANSKYLQKTLSIKGKVNSIDNDNFFGNFMHPKIPTVKLGSWGSYLYCQNATIAELKPENISVGDTVVIKGELSQWSDGRLIVYPCSVEQ